MTGDPEEALIASMFVAKYAGIIVLHFMVKVFPAAGGTHEYLY
jgi:hypothetical protein